VAAGTYGLVNVQPLAAIPKACGFEAATRFASILPGGSLIPIVVIGMGMAFAWLTHTLQTTTSQASPSDINDDFSIVQAA
jgi:hypothetical protein